LRNLPARGEQIWDSPSISGSTDRTGPNKFIQALIDRGFPVTADGVTKEWLEIDTVEDLRVPSNFKAKS